MDHIFDDMVDQILDGEGLVEDFESGLRISAYDLDKIGITIDRPGLLIDLVLEKEELLTLMLFMEVQWAAKANVEGVNWDDLLNGN